MRKKTFRDRKNAGVLYRDRKKTATSSPDLTSKDVVGSGASAALKKRPIFQHLTRLQHGILRYRNVAESPTSVAHAEVSDQDRKFVYFPAGYATQNDKCLQETLLALDLKRLPPLAVVTASTDGAVEEHLEEEEGTQMNNSLGDPLKMDPLKDLDLSEDEERELLREKTHEILKGTVDCCGEMGAWLLPHRPRRANGAAQILCDAVPKDTPHPPVILGLIGLDKQDKENGFADLIASCIYPLGSEIKEVAELSYDPNVRDNTPCPELTHLLIFQRRKEMREFREKLLSQVPELFVAFGNTTNYAKNCLFASLVNSSPVALITHTSKSIDDMALALRHADREMTKVNVGVSDPPPLGIASHAVSGAEATFESFPLPPLPELTHDKELSHFLTIWPATHDDERVVLADPRRVGGILFRQQLLRAIKAAFYTRQARVQALKEATALLKSIQDSSVARNKITEVYHLKMVLATLLAVVAAVLYAKIYGADPAPSLSNQNPYQVALFVATIVIPFVIVLMKRSYDTHSKTWSVVQDDAAKLESAIFEFRARPRSYGQSTSQNDPLEAFISTVRTFRARSRPLLDPEETITSANTASREAHTAEESNATEYDIEAPPLSESSPLLPANMTPSPLEDLQRTSATWEKYSMNESAYADQNLHDSFQEYNTNVISENKMNAAESESNSSPLAIKDYIVERIQKARQCKAEELETLEKRNKTMDTIIKVVLGSTSLLALASKQWFIPIVLGVSAAFASSQEFRKYGKRVENGKSMMAQLDELKSWWEKLSVEDKILSSNQDRLVQKSESIIMADISFTY